MEKIKYLILCLISLLILTSCRHDDNKLYQILPIVKEYEPEYYIFDGDEISKEEWLEMQNLRFIINSEDEFPEDDLMGLEELKESNIDFHKYTLLLGYFKLPGLVLGYRYQYARELATDNLVFYMGFRLDQEADKDPETDNLFSYSRSAILVSKIPEDEDVVFRWSY